MYPRNPPFAPQGPSTPTLSNTITSPVHLPYPSALAHSSNSLGLRSPSPTYSISDLSDHSDANRLDVVSRAFIPRATAELAIKKPDATEVSLENLTKSTPTPSTPAVSSSQNLVLWKGGRDPGSPNQRPHTETENQYKSRLAEREQNDRFKAEAAEAGDMGKFKY